jgi:outer membrane protein TolC
MVSVGVSVPLPWDRANRQDREVASKLAMAEQARAQREEMLRAHAGELRGMLAEWRNGRERLMRYKNDLLPLAAERSKAALAAYQGGKAGITDLLLARRNETDMQMQAVQLEMDTARVWAQLNFLIPANAVHPGAHR